MNGLTPETAIKVPDGKVNSKAIYSYLDKMFGYENGKYFIISEMVTPDKGIDYRTIYLEDKEGTKYIVWFDVTTEE